MQHTFIKPGRPVRRVFIHCSASDRKAHDNVETMDQWHREKGWAGVGYHYFIRKDGTLEVGRDINKVPAAQQDEKRTGIGGNRGTIAICLHGLKRFTPAQFNTLQDLCGQIDRAYFGKVTFHGHCEVAYKSCPVFDYKEVLGLGPDGRLGRMTADLSGSFMSNGEGTPWYRSTTNMAGGAMALTSITGAAAQVSDDAQVAVQNLGPWVFASILVIAAGAGLFWIVRERMRKSRRFGV